MVRARLGRLGTRVGQDRKRDSELLIGLEQGQVDAASLGQARRAAMRGEVPQQRWAAGPRPLDLERPCADETPVPRRSLGHGKKSLSGTAREETVMPFLTSCSGPTKRRPCCRSERQSTVRLGSGQILQAQLARITSAAKSRLVARLARPKWSCDVTTLGVVGPFTPGSVSRRREAASISRRIGELVRQLGRPRRDGGT